MKKNRLASVAVIMAVIMTMMNMEAKNIKLPVPDTKGGMPLNEAVAKRHSVREYDRTREISDSVLGQLLWLTLGINRPEAAPTKFGAPANRTNPTALNRQEIHAYVFRKDGVWKYEPADHSLNSVCEGDHRALMAGTKEFSQDFVMEAPLTVLFIADITGLPDDFSTKAMAMVDAGIACENLNLGCESLGLATVPRATMDSAAILRLLGLPATHLPLLNNPVGYAR